MNQVVKVSEKEFVDTIVRVVGNKCTFAKLTTLTDYAMNKGGTMGNPKNPYVGIKKLVVANVLFNSIYENAMQKIDEEFKVSPHKWADHIEGMPRFLMNARKDNTPAIQVRFVKNSINFRQVLTADLKPFDESLISQWKQNKTSNPIEMPTYHIRSLVSVVVYQTEMVNGEAKGIGGGVTYEIIR